VDTVGERIREPREELGLSLRQAACEGVSGAHICRLQSGDRPPTMKALRKLPAKLQVSVHWLETGESDPALALADLVLASRGPWGAETRSSCRG
jgi:transcriptional regulator with XRE-family HTH domain